MNQYAEAFAAFNQDAESGWLKSQRIAAFARFEHLGFPINGVENWKYTNTKALAKRDFLLPKTVDLDAAREVLKARDVALDDHRLVFVNGVYAPELSNLSGLPAALVVEPLSEALDKELELTCGMMGRLAGIDCDVFTALNFAFAGEGAMIRIGNHQVIEKPISLIHLSVAGDQASMSHPRILVAAGANSQVRLVEHFLGSEEAVHFTNRVAEVVLERNAQLTHYLLQEPGDQSWLVNRTHVEQKRDSRYYCHHINLGGKLVRDDLVCDLNGTGAESEFSGLLFGRNKQHLDIHSLVNHNEPRTYSRETYKAILNDKARGVFNGKVIVKKDSQQIDAQQSNANLLLSDQAEIDTKPELEIYADDVKCSHGATTGQLDETALFYLKSRGLSDELARGLLTLAFANEVVDKIDIEPIYQLVETTVAGHLPHQVNLDDL
ncbi:Fe-S cluster assembly protein SufD [Marinospirillum celere]|uniref:Fe-S cluster assembly protein SufD n=1 Tax=Marinospirillum celere TaxID=1122252 RepID=A0A1I1HCC4_9GAMM|nr:Fe-S cluster assembly protein SufD [Marinospirillum celere]SFC21501.1 Fe-S cluster assembly protein SufD [Marinospirillum celere]